QRAEPQAAEGEGGLLARTGDHAAGSALHLPRAARRIVAGAVGRDDEPGVVEPAALALEQQLLELARPQLEGAHGVDPAVVAAIDEVVARARRPGRRGLLELELAGGGAWRHLPHHEGEPHGQD